MIYSETERFSRKKLILYGVANSSILSGYVIRGLAALANGDFQFFPVCFFLYRFAAHFINITKPFSSFKDEEPQKKKSKREKVRFIALV